jgi:hypothetical protein
VAIPVPATTGWPTLIKMEVVSFLSGMVGVYVLLGYDPATVVVSFLTFRNNAVVSSSTVRMSKKNAHFSSSPLSSSSSSSSSSVLTVAYFN